MIGLESNKITIDIHESKVPLNLLPNFVEVYHDGTLVHDGKINYGCIQTGKVTIDVQKSKRKIDDIFNSAGAYLPFSFKFFVNPKLDKGMQKFGPQFLMMLLKA